MRRFGGGAGPGLDCCFHAPADGRDHPLPGVQRQPSAAQPEALRRGEPAHLRHVQQPPRARAQLRGRSDPAGHPGAGNGHGDGPQRPVEPGAREALHARRPPALEPRRALPAGSGPDGREPRHRFLGSARTQPSGHSRDARFIESGCGKASTTRWSTSVRRLRARRARARAPGPAWARIPARGSSARRSAWPSPWRS